jgi:hypothetical protein
MLLVDTVADASNIATKFVNISRVWENIVDGKNCHCER